MEASTSTFIPLHTTAVHTDAARRCPLRQGTAQRPNSSTLPPSAPRPLDHRARRSDASCSGGGPDPRLSSDGRMLPASPCDAMWGGHGRARGREGGRGYERARETGGLFCALVASCVVAEVRKAACVLRRRAGILAAVAAGAGHLIGKTDAMGSKIGTGGRSLNSVDAASASHPKNESRLSLRPRPAVPYPSRVAAAAVALALASTNESEHHPRCQLSSAPAALVVPHPSLRVLALPVSSHVCPHCRVSSSSSRVPFSCPRTLW
ncbi:hypothetical protein MSAN_02508100 [Mycena sanguinolenta]|uniref:Uncharacterized protein n=1 Tax=Mycena sanguinolenta TaxID=230812 RepID=A0A8H6U139_9AGAR|nr:hypothetical protein MSAN_02508100 [Mycena sanguinolenta]